MSEADCFAQPRPAQQSSYSRRCRYVVSTHLSLTVASNAGRPPADRRGNSSAALLKLTRGDCFKTTLYRHAPPSPPYRFLRLAYVTAFADHGHCNDSPPTCSRLALIKCQEEQLQNVLGRSSKRSQVICSRYAVRA